MKDFGISVIITAYNRNEFIVEAINNVLHQTVIGFSFEIIVVSNFNVNVSDFGPNFEIKTVLMDGTIGEFLFTALKAAKYDIVAFLDDDDTFASGKLLSLMRIFSSNQELCYYHNDMKYIDRAGNTVHYLSLVEKRHRSLDRGNIIFDAKSNLSAIKTALDKRGDFNLSSVAIRKNCYVEYFPLLKQIKGSTDGFFFWTGIISMGQLMIDHKKLTNYRLHDLNVSGQLNFLSKGKELEKQIYTFDLILNFLSTNTHPSSNNEELRNWITLFKCEYELMLAIFINSPRGILMMQIKRLLSISMKYSNTLKYRVLLFSLIGMISHGFAKWIYLSIGYRKHNA